MSRHGENGNVNRDEIRKFAGGYATGTLTDAERQLLMQAALEDQDLFDELMGEQNLKALLETPGAKPRLIRAVTTEKRRAIWAWSSAAVVAATALLIWMLPRTPEPENETVRTAENRPAPAPQPQIETAAAPAPPAEPAPQPAARSAPAEPKALADAAPAIAAGRGAANESAVGAGKSIAPASEAAKQPERNEQRADAAGPSAPAAPAELAPVQPQQAAPPPPKILAPLEIVQQATTAPPPPAAPKAAILSAAVGGVAGTVNDPSGAAIAGVPITARNQETGAATTATSSPTGDFILPLPAGRYDIEAQRAGFVTYRSALTVAPQRTERLDIALQVGQTTETVTVAADTSLLKTEADPAKPAAQSQLRQLPVLGIGAAKGGAGGAKGKAGPAAPLAIAYALTGRSLRLTPAQPGLLLVTAKTPSGTVTVFPRNPVIQANAIVLTIVDAATEVTVAFVARDGIAPAARSQSVTALAGTMSGPSTQELNFSIPVR